MTLEDKIGVTKFFNDNWTATPIHFANLEFDTTGLDEWIRIEYTPMASASLDLAFSDYVHSGRLEVSVFTRKENRAYQLYDTVLNLIKLQKFGGLKVKNIDIINKTDFATINGDYVNLNIGIYLSSLQL